MVIEYIAVSVAIVLVAFIAKFVDSAIGMLYGSILAPILILLGFAPTIIIPAILFSQIVGSAVAASKHHKYGNIDLNSDGKDLRALIILIVPGIFAVIFGSLVAVNLPSEVLETYIGIMVILIGIAVLMKIKTKFSWKKMGLIGFIASFNMALTGAGLGAFLTGGQMAIGKRSKNAIGMSTVAKVPICVAAFLSYMVFSNFSEWGLLALVTIGATVGATMGPKVTKEVMGEKLKMIVGVLTFSIGGYLIASILGLDNLIKMIL